MHQQITSKSQVCEDAAAVLTNIYAHAFLNSAVRILYSVCYSDAKVQSFLATEPIRKRCITCY